MTFGIVYPKDIERLRIEKRAIEKVRDELKRCEFFVD